MTSVLVKAVKTGQSSVQMIKSLRSYDKYRQTPRSDQELADKAKDLGLVDGMPFTYCICDKPSYGSSVISLDLRTLEVEYEQIYNLCNLLATYSPTIKQPPYKPHPFRPERKSGLTRLTETLRRQLQFTQEAVTITEHAILHDEQSIIGEILALPDSRDKVRMLGQLAQLIYNYRRNYFSDIPFLLEVVANEPGDYFLYNYQLSFDDQDLIAEDKVELLVSDSPKLSEAIREVKADKVVLAAQGIDPLAQPNAILAKAKAMGTKPAENYFIKQGLSPAQAAIAAAETINRIESLEADEAKLTAFLQSSKDGIPANQVKPDKAAQRTAEATVNVKTGAGASLQPEDFDGVFTKARRGFTKISGIKPEEISIKFAGGLATPVF